MRKSGVKYIQGAISPKLKKELVHLCQRITDEIEREDREMNVGPMAIYATCYLLTLDDEGAKQVILQGKAKFDQHPLPRPLKQEKTEGKDSASSTPVFKGHEGVLPTVTLPGKTDGRSKRRSKSNQARTGSVD